MLLIHRRKFRTIYTRVSIFSSIKRWKQERDKKKEERENEKKGERENDKMYVKLILVVNQARPKQIHTYLK